MIVYDHEESVDEGVWSEDSLLDECGDDPTAAERWVDFIYDIDQG